VSTVERPLGEFAVGEKGHGCAGLGVERETTVDQTLIPRVGYRLPCLRLGAFLGLKRDLVRLKPWIALPADVPAFEAYYDSKKFWPAESLERRKAVFG
jgi:hypothetical protein